MANATVVNTALVSVASSEAAGAVCHVRSSAESAAVSLAPASSEVGNLLTNALSRTTDRPVTVEPPALELPESWDPLFADTLPEESMEAERIVAYQVALQLQCQASILVPVVNRVLRDQFERASLSVVLNTAEGCGRHSIRQKRYHFGVARGSAMECAAMCDVLKMRRLAPDVETSRTRRLAIRCVQLLTKLDASLAKRVDTGGNDDSASEETRAKSSRRGRRGRVSTEVVA